MSESIGLSVFNSLSDPIAVLDQQGVIRNVNEAWRQFAFPTDYTQISPSPIGLNYVSICARTVGSPNGAEGPLAAEGIRAVIEGKRAEIAAKLAHATLRKAAEVDELTELPNRTVLMQRLQALVERGRAAPEFRFALLFLHLDRFKLVNDTLGHATGDSLLVGFSRRLRNPSSI